MTLPLPNRHPGLVPGSNGRSSEKLGPLVHDSRHLGPRHKAGVTIRVVASAGDLA